MLCCTVELLPQMLCGCPLTTGVVLYCWTITTGVVLYCWTITTGAVLLNYYHRCCTVGLLPQVLYCWTITTGVVLLNYYHRCCIVLLSYYHRCCIAELLPQVLYCTVELLPPVLYRIVDLLPQVLYCWTILPQVLYCWTILPQVLYCRTILPQVLYWRTITTAVVLLNYYHSCRDVAGAALSSFSGPPLPSRTDLPPLTLLVTVSQSINQSINRFCLSIHPYIHVLYHYTRPTYVDCLAEIWPWMLYCTLELLPRTFIVLLNYYD